ncbi:multicopper oxidase family protein [Aquisalimonas lutea]|uniref:multicopper oxidase family protein n=1 Tax=Aquisalimonas lutea TaxID=1327750 RepID=UPI0025B2EF39|nr:multicopper oxidase family protein [Aquisalimonas lutea]MDN3518046.1 multicopper oxidase family protein [Aquisalimonas lutea]
MSDLYRLRGLSRRRFLAASASALGLAALPAWSRRLPATDDLFRLRTGPAPWSLQPVGPAVSGAWGYNGIVPGPTLRYRRGEQLRILLDNGLAQPTSVHWHGIRLPNAMDGVPHLTQPPVAPGETFEYVFELPDAGTYWYHSHLNGPEQLARGLVGALVVEEPDPYPVDRDIAWLLDDWRLTRQGAITEDFNNPHDMSHAGRIGNTVTVNGRLPHAMDVRPGERIRLRLMNAANGRIFGLAFDDLPVHVIAFDGQPVTPHQPEGGRVVIGPGMRADVVLDYPAEADRPFVVRDTFYRGMEYQLMAFTVTGSQVRETAPAGSPPALPANPVPEPNLDGAETREIVFGGGMMGGTGMQQMMRMMREGMAWTVNGRPVEGPGQGNREPTFTLARGQSCRIVFRNDTRWHHPVHLHGHHFRVLTRNGSAEPYQPFRDTVLMNPDDTIEAAFVADNPGDWLFHCHIAEHQAGGMRGMFRVRD